jgi:hypothetical protein
MEMNEIDIRYVFQGTIVRLEEMESKRCSMVMTTRGGQSLCVCVRVQDMDRKVKNDHWFYSCVVLCHHFGTVPSWRKSFIGCVMLELRYALFGNQNEEIYINFETYTFIHK